MQHINNRLLSAVSWQYRWFVQGLRDTKLNTGRAGRRDKSFFKYSEILSSCQLVCYKFILWAPIKRWELNSATQFTTICLKAVWLPKALQEGNFSSFTHTLTSWWWSLFFVSIETVFKQFWSRENVIFFFQWSLFLHRNVFIWLTLFLQGNFWFSVAFSDILHFLGECNHILIFLQLSSSFIYLFFFLRGSWKYVSKLVLSDLVRSRFSLRSHLYIPYPYITVPIPWYSYILLYLKSSCISWEIHYNFV